jgi:RNA polymerase sigma factor (sigma-70 family)
LVDREGDTLRRFVERHGRGLLQFESVEDLVQGATLVALQNESNFEFRGDGAFVTWLQRVAQRFIANRHAYWTARKRDAGHILRITTSDRSEFSRTGGIHPYAGNPPSRPSIREEELMRAARAISLLLPRDQTVLRLVAAEQSTEDIAQELGLAVETARRVRARALQRFRKSLNLLGGWHD